MNNEIKRTTVGKVTIPPTKEEYEKIQLQKEEDERNVREKLTMLYTKTSKYIPICGTGNKVVIKREPQEETTRGGIILHTKSQEQSHKGTIIAISNEDLDGLSPRTEVGDIILFSGYGGTPIKIDGEDLLVMVEKDVLVKFLKDEQ